MIKLDGGQHVVLVGITQSGKTTFERNVVLPSYDRNIVMDSKEKDFNDFPVVSIKQALKLAHSKYAFDVRVILKGDGKLDAADIAEICDGLLTGHCDPVAICWDEVTDFADAGRIPPPLRRLIRKAAGKGVTVIVGTQRAAMLSKDYLSNSVHQIWFATSDYDLKIN